MTVLVPTMGALHKGHQALIKRARTLDKDVIVSIFVNPLQFENKEDLEKYPRNPQRDIEIATIAGANEVWFPEYEDLYPEGFKVLSAGELGNKFEGASRPGHFDGVVTVVDRLFAIAKPDKAVFGEKDFQQLLIIRQMVSDLNLSVEILAGVTKRETDGLAMSSRNNYLNAADREKSRLLSQALMDCRDEIEQGVSIKQAENNCVNTLENHGFSVDYVTFRETIGLQRVSDKEITDNNEFIILAAAKIGDTRLIDNMKVVLSDEA